MKLLLIEIWGLGDTVQVLPVLRALQRFRPNLELVFLTSQSELADLVVKPYVDEIIYIPPLSKWRLLKKLYSLRKKNFNAVILNRNLSMFVHLFLRLFVKMPIVKGAMRWPLVRLRAREHQSGEWISMAKELFPSLERPSEKNSPKKDSKGNSRTVAVHLGSGREQTIKRIPKSVVQKILDGLIPEGLNITVIEGPHERGTGTWISRQYPQSSTLVTPASVTELLSILKGVSFLIAGDTGVGHLASMVGTPVITLAGPTDIFRTAPLGSHNRVIRRDKELWCQPCHHSFRSAWCASRKCLGDLDSAKVVAVAKELIRPR